MKVKELFTDKICTISNMFSLARILLAPVSFWLIYMEYRTGNEIYLSWLLAVIVITFVTDFLDGFLARRLNQITQLGQYLDPLADKIAGYTLLFAVALFRDFPLYILVLGIVREVMVVIGAFHLFRNRNIVVAPNYIGKATVFFMSVTIIMYAVKCNMSLRSIEVRSILASLIVPLYVASGILYIRSYAGYWFEKNS
jgi:CDP-diacylglycerol--glycerol-3-phosphate 3-phosphatidyltransferase